MGVAKTQQANGAYSMRLTLEPERMEHYGLVLYFPVWLYCLFKYTY